MTIATRTLSGLLVVVLAGSALLPAQVIPGRWQKVDLLTAGTEIIIETDSGEVLECMYFSSSREVLLVVESVSKEQRRIPKSSVKRITARKYEDRLTNGALLGMSAGASAGIAVTTFAGTARAKYSVGDRVLAAALFGLVGMGLGVLIDYRHSGREVVYEAPPSGR